MQNNQINDNSDRLTKNWKPVTVRNLDKIESKSTAFSTSTASSLKNDVMIFPNGHDTSADKSSELTFTEFDLVNEIASNNVNRFSEAPEIIISSTRTSNFEVTTPRRTATSTPSTTSTSMTTKMLTTTRAPTTTRATTITTRASTTTKASTTTRVITTTTVPTTTKPLTTTKKYTTPVITTKPFIFTSFSTTQKPIPTFTQEKITSTTQMPTRTTEDFGARNYKLLQQLLAQQISFSQRPTVIRTTSEMVPETTTERLTTTERTTTTTPKTTTKVTTTTTTTELPTTMQSAVVPKAFETRSPVTTSQTKAKKPAFTDADDVDFLVSFIYLFLNFQLISLS